jgi:2'-hydroxyisoflavone reductase
VRGAGLNFLLKRHSVLPGFGLTLGYTVFYTCVVVLIPLSALVFKTATLGWGAFWATVTAPRVLASYQLSFGASLAAALVNAIFGLIVAWVLVRDRFPGKAILDVVIDIPTTLPVWVRDAAQILKGNVDRYIFISTISVFSDNSKPNMDESGPLAEYKGADAMAETQTTLRANMMLYGQLKALSEKEAEKWFPGKALVIRPGLIVGPGDDSDRFTYWPVRIEKGGEVLAPGTPNDPVQIIDARDLAEWVIRMAEQGTVGTFNATGPNYKLTMGKMLNDIKAATKSNATFTFADADFLKAQKVRAWGDMPTWVPPRGETLGFSQVNVQKAISKGLTFRSVGDTTKATLEWFHKQTPERQAKLKSGLTPERETAVLAAWHAQQKPGE